MNIIVYLVCRLVCCITASMLRPGRGVSAHRGKWTFLKVMEFQDPCSKQTSGATWVKSASPFNFPQAAHFISVNGSDSTQARQSGNHKAIKFLIVLSSRHIQFACAACASIDQYCQYAVGVPLQSVAAAPYTHKAPWKIKTMSSAVSPYRPRLLKGILD